MEFEDVFSQLTTVPPISVGSMIMPKVSNGNVLSLWRVTEHIIMILIEDDHADPLYLRVDEIGKGNEAKQDCTRRGLYLIEEVKLLITGSDKSTIGLRNPKPWVFICIFDLAPAIHGPC